LENSDHGEFAWNLSDGTALIVTLGIIYRNSATGSTGMSKSLGTAAVVAVALSIGLPSYNTCCSQNRAKAESVVRAQRWQSWRYAFARSSSVAATADMV
jgi:hypothetical protein